MFYKYWTLHDEPQFLISIIGGSKNSFSEEKSEKFSSGLVKFAQLKYALILTNGLNIGIVKHIGEALKNHSYYKPKFPHMKKVFCLGITRLDKVSQNENLRNFSNEVS